MVDIYGGAEFKRGSAVGSSGLYSWAGNAVTPLATQPLKKSWRRYDKSAPVANSVTAVISIVASRPDLSPRGPTGRKGIQLEHVDISF